LSTLKVILRDKILFNFQGSKNHYSTVKVLYPKNYHMPIVVKSYKTITFYVRGDLEEVKRLLESYIFYLGKKGSQGFGQIKEWEFEEIDEDWSVWKDEKPMRPVPVSECKKQIENMIRRQEPINARQHPIIPPYWRKETELCLMP